MRLHNLPEGKSSSAQGPVRQLVLFAKVWPGEAKRFRLEAGQCLESQPAQLVEGVSAQRRAAGRRREGVGFRMYVPDRTYVVVSRRWREETRWSLGSIERVR